MAGADAIPAVVGPLSTTIEGIEIFMRTVLASRPWLSEPALIPMSWDFTPIRPEQSLKIGIMWHDNVVTPHPPITRALHEVVSRLKTLQNVEVVDFEPYLHDEAWAIVSSLYFTDGGAEDAATIAESGEPWRPLTTWMLKENPCVKKLSPKMLYYWQEEREAYRKEYAKVWNDTATSGQSRRAIDVLLCPAGPGVAPTHNTSKYWAYTSQWNLLDYPAVVFPVTKVNSEVDMAPHKHQAMTDIDKDHWELCEYSARAPWNLQAINFQQTTPVPSPVYQSLYNSLEGDLKMKRLLQSCSTLRSG